MALSSPDSGGKITVQELKGLNERERNANNDIGFFDFLRGAVPTTKNILSRCNGAKLLLKFDAPILAIHQTNDSRGNVIIQTRDAVVVVSEQQLFGIAVTPSNLIPVASTEEESMSQAILVHQVTAGTNGGAYTTANTWQQAPLSAILSQLNPDGSTAAFVTAFAANQFTLAAGVYRIRGWCLLFNSTSGTKISCRLYNVTAGAPAWSGAANEDTMAIGTDGTSNAQLHFGGTLNLAGPTQFELQGLQQRVQLNSGFGLFQSAANFISAKELYRFIEILKTA